MSLLSLYENMEKTANRNNYNQNDEWAQAAAQYGLTVDEFMDKLAEQQVREEVEMTKQAQDATWLGKCMGSGYVDTIVKVACADPVRDEIPEIHIKVAQASLNGLLEHMVKSANVAAKAQMILDALKGAGRSAMQKGDDMLFNLQARTGRGSRGRLVDEARGLTAEGGGMIDKLKSALGVGSKETRLNEIQSALGLKGQGSFGGKNQGIRDLVNSVPKSRDLSEVLGGIRGRMGI